MVAGGVLLESSALHDFRWLVSPDASPYLERAANSAPTVRLTQSLRQELTAERTHLVLEQAALRARARSQDKFRLAEQMFFTSTLLQQATEDRIAFYKAQRFPARKPIVDLCCGLGGDSLGLASQGPVRGVDRDPIAVLLAMANTAAYGQSRFATEVSDAANFVEKITGLWHIDPDRRSEGHRTTQLELFEPALEVLERLRKRQPDGAIKLASATETPAPWLKDGEREWIGSRRECRQQVAWFGALAQSPGLHRATVVDQAGIVHSLTGHPQESCPIAASIQKFLFEPHPAVLAAQLGPSLADQMDLAFLADRIAYLTGDTRRTHPLLSSFEVVDVLPFDLKKVHAALAARRVGRLEIKARGVDIDPSTLRKKLKPKGDEELTLLIAGPQTRVRAILAKRLE